MLIGCVLLFAGEAQAQLRIVSYNTGGGPRDGLDIVLESIGYESVNGIAKPIDVLVLQEQSNVTTTTQAIVDLLNSIYGPGVYARGDLNGATTGAGRPGIVYRIDSVMLLEETTASTVASNSGARETIRYQLRPRGYESEADFYVYASHYKASNTSSDRARRDAEAQEVRANADALGNASIIYAGDFNVYTSDEAMYQTLLSPGNGQAFDPIETPGAWHNDADFKAAHTQSPVTAARYPGQIAGGMDDRFDFQLATGELLDGEGMSYIAGSYRAFGNTGTHDFDGEIISGSATALQARLPGYSTAQAASVLEALAATTDHLPIVADYQVPAAMAVTLGAAPERVIVGAEITLTVGVANAASVVATIGADRLRYTVAGSGAISGGAEGEAYALTGEETHALTLMSDAPGLQGGNVTVITSSKAAANGVFEAAVSYEVLGHAMPSFSADADVRVWTLDFGVLDPGEPGASMEFDIANFTGGLSFQAGLDLDAVEAAGDAEWFSTTLGGFHAMHGSLLFSAAFAGAEAGSYAAAYSLVFSDEDLPGAAAFEPLTLQLVAVVVPEPPAFLLIAVGMLGGIFLFARQPRHVTAGRRRRESTDPGRALLQSGAPIDSRSPLSVAAANSRGSPEEPAPPGRTSPTGRPFPAPPSSAIPVAAIRPVRLSLPAPAASLRACRNSCGSL
jgi:hypothetical protein